MNSEILIPDIMAADVFNISKEMENLLIAGVDTVHICISHQNQKFGLRLCEAVRRSAFSTNIHVSICGDVTSTIIDKLVDLSVRSISIQVDSTSNWIALYRKIKDRGCEVGVILNGNAEVEQYSGYLSDINRVFVTAEVSDFEEVNIKNQLDCIAKVRSLIMDGNCPVRIIAANANLQTIDLYVQAGADSFIVGRSIFDEDDYYTVYFYTA